MEDKYCFDSLPNYRRRKRERITSPRNCCLTVVKKRLSVPVLFSDKRKAAQVFGHLFGYAAGVWILENDRKEFQMAVSVTHDTRRSIEAILERRRSAGAVDGGRTRGRTNSKKPYKQQFNSTNFVQK
jgi:hypothetical protein